MSISSIVLLEPDGDLKEDRDPAQIAIIFITEPGFRAGIHHQGPHLLSLISDVDVKDPDWPGEITMSMLEEELPDQRAMTDHQARQIIHWCDNLHRKEIDFTLVVCAQSQRAATPIAKILAKRYSLKSPVGRKIGNRWILDCMERQNDRRSFESKYGDKDDSEED